LIPSFFPHPSGERVRMRVDNKGEKKTPPYDPLKIEKTKDKR